MIQNERDAPVQLFMYNLEEAAVTTLHSHQWEIGSRQLGS